MYTYARDVNERPSDARTWHVWLPGARRGEQLAAAGPAQSPSRRRRPPRPPRDQPLAAAVDLLPAQHPHAADVDARRLGVAAAAAASACPRSDLGAAARRAGGATSLGRDGGDDRPLEVVGAGAELVAFGRRARHPPASLSAPPCHAARDWRSVTVVLCNDDAKHRAEGPRALALAERRRRRGQRVVELAQRVPAVPIAVRRGDRAVVLGRPAAGVLGEAHVLAKVGGFAAVLAEVQSEATRPTVRPSAAGASHQ